MRLAELEWLELLERLWTVGEEGDFGMCSVLDAIEIFEKGFMELLALTMASRPRRKRMRIS